MIDTSKMTVEELTENIEILQRRIESVTDYRTQSLLISSLERMELARDQKSWA